MKTVATHDDEKSVLEDFVVVGGGGGVAFVDSVAADAADAGGVAGFVIVIGNDGAEDGYDLFHHLVHRRRRAFLFFVGCYRYSGLRSTTWYDNYYGI